MKNQQIDNREKNNWQLTADIILNINNRLSLEYILNNKIIKIEMGAAFVATATILSDIVKIYIITEIYIFLFYAKSILQIAWNPYLGMLNNQWNIEGNNCNPWAVLQPIIGNIAGSIF